MAQVEQIYQGHRSAGNDPNAKKIGIQCTIHRRKFQKLF